MGLLMLIPMQLRFDEGKYVNALFNFVVACLVVFTNLARLKLTNKTEVENKK